VILQNKTAEMRRRSGAFHIDDPEDIIESCSYEQTLNDLNRSMNEDNKIEYVSASDFEETDDSYCIQANKRKESEKGRTVQTFKFLVIGSDSNNNRNVIRSLWDIDTSSRFLKKQEFITQTQTIENQETKHVVWMLDVFNSQHENIIKTYFKLVNTMILIFDPTELESFNFIIKAAQTITSTESKSQRHLVLIGLNNNKRYYPQENCVTESMIQQFMDIFSVNHYFEVNTQDEMASSQYIVEEIVGKRLIESIW